MDSKKDIVSSTGRLTHETTPEEKIDLIGFTRIPWQKYNPLPWFFEGSSIYDAKLQLIFCGVHSDLGRFIIKAANVHKDLVDELQFYLQAAVIGVDISEKYLEATAKLLARAKEEL